MAETISGKESIRMRADALELTLAAAAKKHGLDNPGFESSEPNATKGGQEQEQEQEQEQKVEDSVEDIQRDKDQDSVNVPVQHVSITFRQDVEKGGEGEEGEDHLYPSLEEEEDPDMLKKKESGSALSKALKSSPYNEKSHLTKSEARLAGTKANDKDSESLSGGGGGGDPDRQQWDNPIEFLLSCIAMSVGLGNVWRFPFTAYENGGGAFLIPYLIVLILIGRPLYFMELAIGQFSSRSSVKVWDVVPAARGVGWGQMVANASVVSYYTCLIALAVYYLTASFSSVLPWMVCDHNMTRPGSVCVASGGFGNSTTYDENGKKLKVISAAEQYFKYKVLKESPDITHGVGLPDWQLGLCLAFCYLLLFFILWKGAFTIGKVAYITAIFPYVVLFTLLGRGVTLPGSYDGIMFYITPKWEKLYDPNVWYAAVTQSFFSLSVGFGPLFTYGSYNGFRHNIYRDATIISLADTFTSMLAGFTIFSILGNLAQELDVPVGEVIDNGAALAFISYPMAIGKMDYVPQVFAVLFFLMLITLGLGSVTGLASGLIAIICDQKPDWNKTTVTFFFCVVGCIVGLVYVTPGGQHLLTLVDYFGGGFAIFTLTIVEVVGISWIYGVNNFMRDVKFMIGTSLGPYWKICLGGFIPASLALILVYALYTFEPVKYSGKVLPDYAMYGGWALALFALVQIPFWFVYEMFLMPGNTCSKKITNTFKPNDNWGPKEPKTKLDWIREESDRQIDAVLAAD